MATAKQCSMCTKLLGSVHCTGCDKYFCWKDITTHREGMFIEMDKIVEEHNHLQDRINNQPQSDNQQNPIIEQIESWERDTIEKVKQAAIQARRHAIKFLDAKRTKITIEFKNFSQELARLKESEDYVEHDLTRLNRMVTQFNEDLQNAIQPTTIVLHTEQSNEINWERLICVEEQRRTDIEKPPAPASIPPPVPLVCLDTSFTTSSLFLKCNQNVCYEM